MASVYAAHDLAAAADLGTGTKALALQTASVIYGRTVSAQAVVGHLAISIPFLAWAALKRMENLGTALVGGLSGLQAMLSGSTAGPTFGNTALGNVAMDQMQLAPNRSSAFMGGWQHDLSGNTFSANVLTGRTAVSLLRNQGFASRVLSTRVSEQDTQEASQMVDAARSASVAANQERAAVLTEAFTKSLATLQASRTSTGTTSSSFEQSGETLNRLDQVSRSVADATGLTQMQVARIALGASGHLGVSTPLGGLQGQASAAKNYASAISSAEQKVLSSMTSEQLAEFKQFGQRVLRDRSFVRTIAQDAREAQDLSARLSSTTNRSERAQAVLAERNAYAEQITAAHERGEAIAIDIAQDPHNLAMFMRYAEQYGSSSAGARVLMDAELARRSLRPQQRFSDGSAAPAAFGDPAEQHRGHLDGSVPDGAVAERHRENESAARGFGDARRRATPTEPAPGLRDAIRSAGDRIRAAASADQATFERNAQVSKTPDGTLATERSLMLQSGKQVAHDAAPIVEDATKAVRNALRK